MSRGKRRKIETWEQADEHIERLERAVRELRERVEAIDPPAILAAAEQHKQSVAELHRAMSIMTLKVTVMTELPRFMRKNRVDPNLYVARLVAALDHPDDWWMQRQNLLLESWAREIARTEPAEGLA